MSITLPLARNKEQLLAWAKRQKQSTLSTTQEKALDEVYPEWSMTQDRQWLAKLEKVAAFVGAHGRFPRAAAQDAGEKAAGIWIATQRYRVDVLPEDRTKLLDERLPGWNKSKDELWDERLEEVSAIVAGLGRLPRSGDEDPEVRSAATWLRSHFKSPASDPRVLTLDARIPGWNEGSRERMWLRNLEALEAFVSEHGRLPSQREVDPENRRIGVWLNTRRQGATSMQKHHRELLDQRVPGWDRTAEDKWLECLEFAAGYLAEHGKLPSEHSSDPDVAASGRWVGTQRRSGPQPAHRKSALDSRLPGWQMSKDDKWEAMLGFVAAFYSQHGRFPASKVAAPEECRAAMWLQRQRQGTGMTTERESRLDELVPSWRETAEDVWLRNLAGCESFYLRNGRRPVPTASETEERKLGVWLSNANRYATSGSRAKALASAKLGDDRNREQVWSDMLSAVTSFRQAHDRFPTATGKVPGEQQLATWLTNHRSARATISPERRAAMDESIPGWDLTLEDLWRLRLDECAKFAEEHGRMPSSGKSGPLAEQRLAGWLLHQRKPAALKRPDRIKLLDELLPGWRG